MTALSGLQERALRALAGASIDPGELRFAELAGRLRDVDPIVLYSTLLGLEELGLVEVIDSLSTGAWVSWTEAGRQLAVEGRFPCAART